MSRVVKILFIVFAVGAAHAQMAHEVLLLVNRNSQDSLLVANTFAQIRQIPQRNIVYLDIPESACNGSATVTPEEFTQLIWEPANAAAQERGVGEQILAWVYSVDFPIRVKTDSNDRKQMSVGGLTFMRNQIPGLSLVEEGKYLSKLFAGPNGRLKANLSSSALYAYKHGLGMDAKVPPEAAYLQAGLGDRMPLPSMMLGYTGENGNSVEEVLESMRRGRASDYRGMLAGIYFVMDDDVRSQCREWQFYPVVNELSKRNIGAVVATNFPVGASNVMGLMMGAETVDPSSIGSFAPGAMAEHLTSWSAEFQKPQTKATRWIAAGATASAGAVVEPYANPDKFPSARFFPHYTSGCTMLESFYQSIACPLQLLLLGEPMARPYAVPMVAQVLGADTIGRDFTYIAKAQCNLPKIGYRYTFLLDGRMIQEASDDPTIYIRPIQLADGYHELRVMAELNHPIRAGASAVKAFTVDRGGRSVSIQSNIEKTDRHSHSVGVEVGGTEMPEKLRLMSGVRMLDETDYAADATLKLDELVIGEGPNRIQAVAVYADGMEVASPPLEFEIKFDGGS